jgi:FMN reductase
LTTTAVGNPKPTSRTLAASILLVEKLTACGPDHGIDLVDLGPSLLGWGDEKVASAVRTAQASSLVVLGTPTFKATYSRLPDKTASGRTCGRLHRRHDK